MERLIVLFACNLLLSLSLLFCVSSSSVSMTHGTSSPTSFVCGDSAFSKFLFCSPFILGENK